MSVRPPPKLRFILCTPLIQNMEQSADCVRSLLNLIFQILKERPEENDDWRLGSKSALNLIVLSFQHIAVHNEIR